MKKILLLFLLCFSFLTLTACDNDDPQDDDNPRVNRQEDGIMEDLIDGVKSPFE